MSDQQSRERGAVTPPESGVEVPDVASPGQAPERNALNVEAVTAA